jgi:hypothetical protein
MSSPAADACIGTKGASSKRLKTRRFTDFTA